MTTTLTQPVRMTILSEPLHLPVVRAATEKLCELIGFSAEVAGSVVLCVDEALTNIIRHAYGNAADRPIEIELVPMPGADGASGLEVRLRDYGPAVDPSRIRSRDLDDVRPGGLGVHIMNRCMDEVEYRAAEGGGTLLRLVKRGNVACKDGER